MVQRVPESSSLRVVRRRRGAAPPPVARASLTAAVEPITDPAATLKKKTSAGAFGRKSWQDEAWHFYRTVGEFAYYVLWRAGSCSRAQLVASAIDPLTGQPSQSIDPDDADGQRFAEIVRGIAGGPQGQTALIRRVVEVLSVAGEVWVAILVTDTGEVWQPVTGKELVAKPGGGVTIKLAGGDHDFNPAAGDGLIRIWQPDPEEASKPFAPVVACLGSLREIEATTATIATASRSRLIGNGILFIPQECSLPRAAPSAATGADELTAVPVEQQLQDLIVKVATAAETDPSSMASVVPLVAAAPGEWIDKIKHLRIDNSVTESAIAGREAAMRRLAIGLDVSPERITGMGQANHWCVDTETEILTQRGWLAYDQLGVGDKALGIDPDTGLSTWTPVTDVYRADVVDEPMLSMQTRTHSSLTTMNHRWLVANRWTDKLRFKTSAHLRSEDMIPTAAPHRDTPDTAKFSDEFVELMAWYWTEGSNGSSVSIAQSHTRNPDRVARIRNCLTRMIGPASTTRMSSATPQWREAVQLNRSSFGGPITVFRLNGPASAELRSWAPDKIVDLEFVRHLTRAQLELFIDVSAQGDGQHYRSGFLDLWQRDGSALDAYELALILSGRMVQRQQVDGGHRVGVWKRKAVNPHKAAMNRNAAASVGVQPYTGVVWCPVTGTGTWFARRNGKSFFTGNSAWSITDQDVQMHITPAMSLVVQAIYDGVLRTVLTDEGIDPNRYTLWFDTSGLTADPDKTDEAKAAFAAGTITSEAYVRLLGLADGDLYDFASADGWRVWAQDRVSEDPTRLPMLAPLLAPLQGIDFPAPAALPAAPADTTPPDGGSGAQQQQEPGTENTSSAASVVASAGIDGAEGLAVEFALARALELAGKRRVNTGDTVQRARLRGIAPAEYHAVMGPVPDADVARLIRDWDSIINDGSLIAAGVSPGVVRARVEVLARRALTAPLLEGQVI